MDVEAEEEREMENEKKTEQGGTKPYWDEHGILGTTFVSHCRCCTYPLVPTDGLSIILASSTIILLDTEAMLFFVLVQHCHHAANIW